MGIDIHLAPADENWRAWTQQKVDEWFSANSESEQIAKNVWWMYFLANIEISAGPITDRWPMLRKFSVDCVLNAADTRLFQDELRNLRSCLYMIPSTEVRIVIDPPESVLAPGAVVSREQMNQIMAAQVKHVRLCVEKTQEFVRLWTDRLSPTDTMEFLRNSVPEQIIPETLADLFNLQLSGLIAIVEKAVLKSYGVLCY